MYIHAHTHPLGKVKFSYTALYFVPSKCSLIPRKKRMYIPASEALGPAVWSYFPQSLWIVNCKENQQLCYTRKVPDFEKCSLSGQGQNTKKKQFSCPTCTAFGRNWHTTYISPQNALQRIYLNVAPSFNAICAFLNHSEILPKLINLCGPGIFRLPSWSPRTYL